LVSELVRAKVFTVSKGREKTWTREYDQKGETEAAL